MNQQQAPQDIIAQLLKSKVTPMPFDDFEERMMLRIRQETTASKQKWMDIKLSSLFFTIGCCLGIVATLIAYTYNWDNVHHQKGSPIFLPVALMVIVAVFYYQWPIIKKALRRV